MAALKEGIQLNQPAPRLHRANRRPLYIAVVAMIAVFALLVWAWVVRSNIKAIAQAKTISNPATPATSAIKSLDRQWEDKTPKAEGMAAIDPAQPTPITLQPVQQPFAMSQPLYTQIPQVTPQQQAQLETEHEQRVAWESPLVPNRQAETVATNGPQTQPGQIVVPANGPQSHPEQNDYLSQNLQDSKKAFAGIGQDKTGLIIAPPGQLPRYMVKAGWDIPAILEQAANSDLPGELRARVRENVYDTSSGRFLLIPQNSILVGRYNSDIAYAQNRVQVNWDRLQRPGNEPTIFLNQMNGVDANGSAGVTGHVDNHFKRLIGFALLSSAFASGIEVSQSHNNSANGYPSLGQAAGSGIGVQMGEFGRKITERNLNRPPTIQLMPGTRFNVRVDRDIEFAEPAR
jgi:type IV secretory pathway VirB10-like protein